MKHDLRIVFMGTPEFAAASLQALAEAGYTIAGVVTAPDKPAGRGKKLREPAVKTYARSQGMKVLQPANLKDPGFLAEFKALNANLGVVVAFRMLPEAVWTAPELGTFNLHASLLPQYRGAAPINHALINGESMTGVTTFFLKHAIDTGNIIFREKVPVTPSDNAGTLHDKLMEAGAHLVIKTVSAIENDNYTLTDQRDLLAPGEELKPAPKIFKEDCRINWNKPGGQIHNLIRGLSPVPGAFAFLQSPDNKHIQVKIPDAEFLPEPHQHAPGNIRLHQNRQLGIYVEGGIINIFEIQAEGKKKLPVRDFLNGMQLTEDWKMI